MFNHLPIWKKALISVGAIISICVCIFYINIIIIQKQSDTLSVNLNKLKHIQLDLQLAHLFEKKSIYLMLRYMDAIVDKESRSVDPSILDTHKEFYDWFNQIKKDYVSLLLDDTNLMTEFNLTLKDIEKNYFIGEKLFKSILINDNSGVYEEYDDNLDTNLKKIIERNAKVLKKLNIKNEYILKHSNDLDDNNVLIETISISIMFILGMVILFIFVKNINISLADITNKIQESSRKIQKDSQVISENSHLLSKAAQGSDKGIQLIASSVEEINNMVQRNADSAKSSTNVSKKSKQVASEGKVNVELVIEAINKIDQTNQHMMTEISKNSEEIAQIVRVISEIGEKTKVINDIVFQTKLLSFNASVEAARAQEHGKGFAVVAEEVGNLAAMSGKAAHEITNLLDQSIKQVSEIVETTKQNVVLFKKSGKEVIDNGTRIAQKCRVSLEEVLSNVEQVNQRVEEIASASVEQSVGVKEVTKSVHELDTATHQNSNIAKNALTISDSLSLQSKILNSTVDHLFSLIG